MALSLPFGSALGNVTTGNINLRGQVLLFVWGTFGGASIQMQFSPDDGTTWFSLGSAITSATAAPGVLQQLPMGCLLRAVITGGTANAINIGFGSMGNY